MPPFDPSQLSGDAQTVHAALVVRFGEEKASELIQSLTKVGNTFKSTSENAQKVEKAVSMMAGGFRKASSAINSFGSFFNASNLSLKSGVDLAYRYNQAFVATFSQFQKYGQSVKNYKDQVDSIRKTYKFTYEESIRLASGFEKSFNILGPEKMNNVLKSIANTVGADNQAMDSFLQSITSVTAQNPLLEEMLENVEANADAIKEYVGGLRIAGEVSAQEYKDFLNLTSSTKRNSSDKNDLGVMQNQNSSLRQIQNIYEDGILRAGQDILSVTKSTVDLVGEWANYMPNILRYYTEISAITGGVAGGASAIFDTIRSMAALRILASGAGAAGTAGAVALGGMAAYGGYKAGGMAYGYMDKNWDLGGRIERAAYGTKKGEPLQQYAADPGAASKREAYLQRHKKEIEANEKVLASERRIAQEQKKQEKTQQNLEAQRLKAVSSFQRQKDLVGDITRLFEVQIAYAGRVGGGSRKGFDSLNFELDEKEKTARDLLASTKNRAIADGSINDKKTRQEIAKIEAELLGIQKERTDAAKMYIKENEPQIEQEKSRISLAEQSIALADSAGLGLRAQVGQRKELINLINTQLALNEKQLQRALQEKAEAERRGDTYKVFEIESEILKIRQEQVSAVQKQAEASKSMREGWIGAISAMTQGAGVFSRILITQDKALGNLQFASPDRIATLRGGGVSGGRTQSARWTPGGFVEGAAGSYENGVLGQYGIPSGSGIQGIAAAMIAWQASVGSKMNPSAAAFGV